MHKVAGKRQMFLSENHTLRFVHNLHKIKHIKLHYYGVLSPWISNFLKGCAAMGEFLNVPELFGSDVFNEATMQQRLPEAVYNA